MKVTEIKFITPRQQVVDVSRSSGASFSIEASGEGSFSGLNYSIPAHSTGKILTKLNIMCMTSDNVKNLNSLAMGMLDASAREEVREREKISTSANLSIWSWFFGGSAASASYEKTRNTMKSKGLTNQQVDKIIDEFLKIARTMSTTELDLTIDNNQNNYSVSGDLFLYTVSGVVKTNKGTHQYRMLADRGNAGALPGEGGAPVSGRIIPIIDLN